ncbi:MAG: RCC1 domain-containing protein, partial [Mycobacteriales bacterium]
RYIPAQVEGLTDVRLVAAGGGHSLAVRSDGSVYTWGCNDRGQLGDGTVTNRARPVRVLGMRGAVAVVASGGGGDSDPGGRGHSMALLDDGTVWTWGCNDHGELGDGTTTERHTPVQVTSLQGVRRITAGGEVPNFRENPGGGYGLAIH